MSNQQDETVAGQDQHPFRGALYDGAPYSFIFDRMLHGLHQRVATWVPEGTTCLDVCCGTGGLTFALAERCRRVDGIDHSPKMIARADAARRERGIDSVSFRIGDASNLAGIADGAFDVATVVLGLHEMPSDIRDRVLPELHRVARSVVIADFAVPMPLNTAGLRNRTIELLAGPRHFAGFRDYTRRGGLPALIEAAGARTERSRRMDGKTLLLVELRS